MTSAMAGSPTETLLTGERNLNKRDLPTTIFKGGYLAADLVSFETGACAKAWLDTNKYEASKQTLNPSAAKT